MPEGVWGVDPRCPRPSADPGQARLEREYRYFDDSLRPFGFDVTAMPLSGSRKTMSLAVVMDSGRSKYWVRVAASCIWCILHLMPRDVAVDTLWQCHVPGTVLCVSICQKGTAWAVPSSS